MELEYAKHYMGVGNTRQGIVEILAGGLCPAVDIPAEEEVEEETFHKIIYRFTDKTVDER